MTGHVLRHSEHQHQVPFKVLFKAVFGFALAAILLVGAVFVLVDDGISARIMLPLQIVAALAGAVLGAFGAIRAGRDAPTPH